MNSVFLVVIAAMILIVVLLRFKVLIGPAILSGGLLIWLFESRSFEKLWVAFTETLTMQRTWDLLLCLYFVMCLEVELRKSGSLHGMVVTLRNIFSSNKVTLAFMPAFLGLLPSLGGARFSAPIVQEASEGIAVDDEQKSAINLWFRHIFEFSNPLMPGVILACGIANVSIGDLIDQVGWVTILCFVLGWIFLIVPLKITDPEKATNTQHDRTIDWKSLILAFGPIVTSFLLIVAFDVQAALAMGLVVVAFIPLYFWFKRPISVKSVFTESLDKKLFFNVVCILYFIQLLTVIGTLDEIVNFFNNSALPQAVIIACLSFIFGVMTGMGQGYIAIVMPIVALMAPGNIVLVGIAMVYGMAGQMVTPTHLCILVTVEYFKSRLWKTIGKCGVLSLLMILIFSAWTYWRYYL
jgi:integral membrane protein (TIGR00529 family)